MKDVIAPRGEMGKKGNLTPAMHTWRLPRCVAPSPKEAYFLDPLFIRPHRKDISHEHDTDAPRERDPDVIAHWPT
jgi:hypothetical protein